MKPPARGNAAYDERTRKPRQLANWNCDGIGRPAMVTDSSDNSFSEQIWECCHVGESRSGKVVGGQDRVKDSVRLFHDHCGLPTRSIDSAGRTTQLGYDDVGRITTLTDPMNRVSSGI